MSWYLLSGAFLAGLAAWAVPLILHWLQRKPKNPVVFPSFDFLLSARKTNRRTNNWRKWLVLLLRLAAIALFVAAFCRPYRAGSAPRPERVRLLLWDDSASAGGDGTRDELELRLRSELATVTPGDPAAIGLVREKGRVRWSGDFSGDGKALASWFAANRRNEGTSAFAALPVRLDFRLKNQVAPRREAVFFSDLQALPWKGMAADAPLLEADAVRLESAPLAANAVSLRAPEVLVIPAASPQEPGVLNVACELFNPGSKPQRCLSVTAETLEGAREELRVDVLAPGEIRRLDFRLTLKNGATAGVIRVDATDSFALDNVLYFACDPAAQTRLLIGAPPKGHFDFTALALGVQTGDPAKWPLEETADAPGRMVFWQNPAELTPAAQQRLAAFVAAGGTLVLNLEAGCPALSALVEKWGVELSPRRAGVEGTFHFGSFDFTHPALARMRDWSLNGWFHVLFFYVCRAKLPPGARVLAAFDDGCPAVAELTAGRGKVLLVFAGFAPGAGNWTKHYSFLPFWRELVGFYTRKSRPAEFFSVGDTLVPGVGARLERRTADGGWEPVENGSGAARFDRAGIYRRAGAGGTRLYAVNQPGEELDFSTLAVAPLPKGAPAIGRPRPAAPEPERGAKDEIFRTLLWCSLACWLAGLALANRTAL